MAKKDCPAGRKWDHLVNVCVSSTAKTTSEPKPSTGEFLLSEDFKYLCPEKGPNVKVLNHLFGLN